MSKEQCPHENPLPTSNDVGLNQEHKTFRKPHGLTRDRGIVYDFPLEKHRLDINDPEFQAFAKSHLWENRQELDPPWPYRGAHACDFFSEIYAPWLENKFISQRDLSLVDAALEMKIRNEMSKGVSRPEGLVTESKAQILEIDDSFEREVERRLRARISEKKKRYRHRKKAANGTDFTFEPE